VISRALEAVEGTMAHNISYVAVLGYMQEYNQKPSSAAGDVMKNLIFRGWWQSEECDEECIH
jgi:hypothetical protein